MDVQEIRSLRNKAVVIFAKFCQNKDKFEEGLFCFYEGEDVKYYESRVEEYTKIPYQNIINFNCGGKGEVIKVREMINAKRVYDKVKKAFFVDRDYFRMKEKGEDIYETECYSIENFYTSKEAFEKILKRAFGMNIFEEDFLNCVKDYLYTFNKFHQEVKLLNAWLKCQRKHESVTGKRNVKMSDIKITKLFKEIAIDNIQITQKIDEMMLYKMFPDAVVIEKQELDNSLEDMGRCNQQQNYRGKFEIEFLKKVIADLRKKNKSGTYFNQRYECVKLDPNMDTLLSLSQFADTPDSLKEFLEKYKEVS